MWFVWKYAQSTKGGVTYQYIFIPFKYINIIWNLVEKYFLNWTVSMYFIFNELDKWDYSTRKAQPQSSNVSLALCLQRKKDHYGSTGNNKQEPYL
jgi:hypothetical protein